MSDLDRLMASARGSVRQLAGLAAERLLAGADVGLVQANYVVPALALLEEAELQAVLAVGGDERALQEIERIVRQLDELHTALEGEGSV